MQSAPSSVDPRPQQSSPSLRPAPRPVTQPEALLVPGASVRGRFYQSPTLYAIDAISGDSLHVIVAQDGVDLIATLLSPDHEDLLRVDSPTGKYGKEHLHWVCQRTGRYLLKLTPYVSDSSEGDFVLSLLIHRPATVRDLARAEAARRLATAETWLGREDVESYKKAHHELQSALRRMEGDDSETKLLIQGRLAWTSFQLGQSQRAADLYSAAMIDSQRLGFSELELWLNNSSASLNRRLGRMDQAEANYKRALALARQLGNLHEETVAINNHALIQRLKGRPWLALMLYDKALRGWRQLGDEAGEAVTLHNLGITELGLQRFPEAKIALRKALKLLDGDLSAMAATLTVLGTAAARSGDLPEAEAILQHALEIRQQLGDRRGEAVTLNELATLALDQGDEETAERILQQTRAIFRRYSDRSSEAHTVRRLGVLIGKQGRAQEALTLFEIADGHYRALGEKEGRAEVAASRARLRLDHHRPKDALEHVQQAWHEIESVRKATKGPTLRSDYSGSVHGIHELHVQILVALHRRYPEAGFDVRAFEAAETVRARSLRESLTSWSGSSGDADHSPQLEQRIREVELERMEAEQEGRAEPLEELQNELQRLLFDLDQTKPAEAPQAPLGLTKIREEILEERDLLLFFSTGRDESYLFALGREGLTVHTLADREVLKENVSRLHRLLAQPPRRGARMPIQMASESLGRRLLGSVAERLGDRRLIIVADGPLHLVPWPAVTRPGLGGSSHGEGEPLIVSHELVSAPSGSTIAALRKRKLHSRVPGKLAIVSDPIFSHSDPRFQPAEIGSSLAAARGDSVSRGEWLLGTPPEHLNGSEMASPNNPADLERLPFSLIETQSILKLISNQGHFVATGFDANRKLVLEETLRNYQIIHFATHGLLHEEPALSGLVLSLFDRTGTPQDGFLRSFEIAGLKIPADLVVLGACRSALGEHIQGEGIMGLPRSFLTAGAASVLVSLWDISDPGTAELMRLFYQAMFQKEERPAAALRQAQLGLRSDPRWEDPYYWAGFVLQGDWH